MRSLSIISYFPRLKVAVLGGSLLSGAAVTTFAGAVAAAPKAAAAKGEGTATAAGPDAATKKAAREAYGAGEKAYGSADYTTALALAPNSEKAYLGRAISLQSSGQAGTIDRRQLRKRSHKRQIRRRGCNRLQSAPGYSHLGHLRRVGAPTRQRGIAPTTIGPCSPTLTASVSRTPTRARGGLWCSWCMAFL